MKKKPTALGIGLIALDVVTGGSEHNDKDGLYAGGTCGDVMSLLSFFGWNAQPVGRLDDDAAGKLVRSDLVRFGVCLDYLGLEPAAATPVVMQKIILDREQPRHVFTWSCSECGARFPGYQPVTLTAIDQLLERVEVPTVLFCDRASPGAVRLAEHCVERGAILLYEAAGIGSPNHFRRMLELAHVLKYSHETQKAVDLLHSENPDTALLEIETLGASGLRYRMRTTNDQRWHERSAFAPPRLRDAAGSGDWLTAGLIDQLCRAGIAGLRALDSESAVSALDRAQAMSAWNCAFEGARGGMYGMTPARVAAVAEKIRAHTAGASVLSKTGGGGPQGAFCGECARPVSRKPKPVAVTKSHSRRKSGAVRV